MKVKVWSFITIFCMAVCLSCSDDEPKSDSNDNELTDSGQTDSDSNDAEDGDDPTDTEVIEPVISMEALTEKPWVGQYYFAHETGNVKFERVEVSFEPCEGLNGVGTMIVNNDGEVSEYKVDFTITRFQVECKATKVDKNSAMSQEENVDIAFVYNNGKLHLRAKNFPRVFLGNSSTILSDIKGEFNSNPNMIFQVWLSENGLNILDFRSNYMARVYQLVESGSKECNYYDTSWDNPILSYSFYRDYAIHFDGFCAYIGWQISEITPERVVLTRNSVDVVYNIATKDIIPSGDSVYGNTLWDHAPWEG